MCLARDRFAGFIRDVETDARGVRQHHFRCAGVALSDGKFDGGRSAAEVVHFQLDFTHGDLETVMAIAVWIGRCAAFSERDTDGGGGDSPALRANELTLHRADLITAHCQSLANRLGCGCPHGEEALDDDLFSRSDLDIFADHFFFRPSDAEQDDGITSFVCGIDGVNPADAIGVTGCFKTGQVILGANLLRLIGLVAQNGGDEDALHAIAHPIFVTLKHPAVLRRSGD